MFPLLQLILILLGTTLVHIGITSPNPIHSNDYVPYEGTGSKFVSKISPVLGKSLIWTFTLYEALYMFLQIFLPSLISKLYPQIVTFIDPLPLTVLSLVGYSFMIIGGLGRIWCYKTLGKFFTFEITIRDSHKLIKTGPYAYVRHPSYTFICIMVLGILIIHQRVANFFPNHTWVQYMFGPIGVSPSVVIMTLILTRRVKREESELAKRFGKEWTQYASQTKRFIPKLI